MNSIVMDFALTDKLQYILHSDFQTRRADPATLPVGAPPGTPYAWKQYGINNYLIYELNDRWSAGTRYEWFYAGEGVGNPLGPAALTPGVHYNALTFGLNFRPRENFLFKPEMRYDWVDFDGPAVFGGPFDGGTARSQFTWGMQGIYTF